MFRGQSRRLFGQFREGNIIRGAFTFTDSGDTWAPVTLNGTTWTGFTVADAGTGLVTVTFPKARYIEVLEASIRNGTVGTAANLRTVELPPMTSAIAKAGTFGLCLYKDDGVSGIPALSDPNDQAVLGLVLYLGQ